MHRAVPTKQASLRGWHMWVFVSVSPALWLCACPQVAVFPTPVAWVSMALSISACCLCHWCLYAHLPMCNQSSHSSASLPDPILVSLRPGSELLRPHPLPAERPVFHSMAPASPRLLNQTEKLAAEGGWRSSSLLEEKTPRWAAEHRLEEKKSWLTNGFDVFECPPPKTENEV